MRAVAGNVSKVVNPAWTANPAVILLGEAGMVSTPSVGVTSFAAPCRRVGGFTLVELLVVIGIIALLVGVLLPALNKARQQANLIDCQSRLRQMGQALNIYASENNGLLPLGDVKYDPTGSSGIATTWMNASQLSSNEESWYWDFTLSQLIQANILGPDRLVHNLSPIFHDVDTVDDAIYGRYVNHYTCNPKIFPDNYELYYLQNGTTISPQYVNNRKLSNVKPSTAFLFWDAPQVFNWGPGNVSYEMATEIDCNAIDFDSYLFVGTPISGNPPQYNYNRAALPGGIVKNYTNLSISVAQQKLYNVDQGGQPTPILDYFVSHMRFRHLNNTTLNALCVDGHVETRAVGTFMVMDICINSPG
jgi:prepilin-type N-terminal cleavage/methylation domain-containing protein